LAIGYHVPDPDRDSGAKRLFLQLQLLVEDGWNVRFLAADGIGPESGRTLLQRAGITVIDGYRHTIDGIIAEERPQLALIAFWRNAWRYLPGIRRLAPDCHVIVDSVDLHLLRETRRVLRAVEGGGRLGISQAQAMDFADELNTYAGSDLVLTVSPREASLIDDLVLRRGRALSVPDWEATLPVGAPLAARRGMVFVGSFEYGPNIEAVEWLCGEVLPRVPAELLERHPVHIVGNALGDRVREAGRDLPSVRMTGWVPFVEPYVERSRVSLVPLRHGAGTKRKIVQAALSGTPSVSTSIGIEGLDLQDGVHALVADDPVAFAAGIERLLTDDALWEQLSEGARTSVTRTNGPRVGRAAFRKAIEVVLGRQPQRVVPWGSGRAPLPGEPPFALDPAAAARAALRAAVPSRASVAVVGLPAAHLWFDDLLVIEIGGAAELEARLAADQAGGFDHLLLVGDGLLLLDRHPGIRDRLDRDWRLVHRDEQVLVLRRPRPLDEPVGVAEGRPRIGGSAGVTEPGVRADQAEDRVRLLAFYLPQFHPIPENDAWWGTGFTEWRNVARATPQFDGHRQPRIPGELGFYDLRLRETRAQQAELARAHGIHGFCYYHYWFEGRRLLERPFEEVLASGEPSLPFALCWANDPWSRRWDGREDELLMRQAYSPRDDLEHIRWLLPALADPRAITVEGRPLFLVYRPSHLPDPRRTADVWRREVERAGLPGIHLVAVETAWDLGRDPRLTGFDASVMFQPQFGWLLTSELGQRARRAIADKPELKVYDYDQVRRAIHALPAAAYRRYETVVPGWDNTARVGDRATVLDGATPAGYEHWLRDAVARAMDQPAGHRLVFVNAWNEWAEGAYLEPDRAEGRAYLEATQRVMAGTPGGRTPR
jgi:glycosyltransferase involved in cell wall biosynthesis